MMREGEIFKQIIQKVKSAGRYGDKRLKSESLLLAILEEDCMASRLLKRYGVTKTKLDKISQKLEGEEKDVLEEIQSHSLNIAKLCKARELDDLHLLLGLFKLPHLRAYRCLKDIGININQVRNLALSWTTLHSSKGLSPSEKRVSHSVKTSAKKKKQLYLLKPDSIKSRIPSHSKNSLFYLKAKNPSLSSKNLWTLDPKKFALLNSFGRNLCAEAYEGKLDPVSGREREINQVIDVLNKRRANNPCLVGPAGVGKTAIVEGLATKIVSYKKIPGLENKVIIELRMGEILAGTHLRGALSERISGILKEVKEAKGRIIIFIDEIHTIVGVTGEGEALDLANELKSALARGEFPCIGATTWHEYKRYFESDPALSRRFTLIDVREPTEKETFKILKDLAAKYEDHHKITYEEDALWTASTLASRYLREYHLPDSALKVIDLAGAQAQRHGLKTVKEKEIREVVATLAHVPADRLTQGTLKDMLKVEAYLKSRIVGHRPILQKIAEILCQNLAGFQSQRPLASFLFLGPGGVGKTETAKALAECLYPEGEALTRIDMSEFKEPHSLSRLIGAPPGYIGWDKGSQLIDAVRYKPYQLILFDQIDKAHRNVLNIVYQILEEGRLKDGKAQSVSFSNTVIVMTATLENNKKKNFKIGFGENKEEPKKDEYIQQAQRILPADLWSRIDKILVFYPLTYKEIIEIGKKMLQSFSMKLKKEKGINITIEDKVIDFLASNGGLNPSLGARPMRQVIHELILTPLAKEILKANTNIKIKLYQGKIQFVGTSKLL